mmetsp:Transcript_27104/g.41555  ORF Transcript_27104/g.41555 Transcript_27104/m.41555 type:complete len:392 (+) Transcript_27104:247-1422(+)|eukprot:CAMPEP_0195310160 /NCGR_PEP_ID=MMETSP0707-20130614/39106_1 /TAXON_ID=33640 /ORGANISM="Asterionellopsis glacialis, Strain CCMP134" /LENGTH=391 /DNA_ID=CAMNT_0040374471 /DNA_START=174 /DNA_END=1349 /DNA_ORIENTATION=-
MKKDYLLPMIRLFPHVATLVLVLTTDRAVHPVLGLAKQNTPSNHNHHHRPNAIHTLILCRHGDSIWNGGQPGQYETFTGWTDVPLSEKGLAEAKNTGTQVSSYTLGIDACFTSILGRAQLTAHHCLWAFAEKPCGMEPRKYVTDYRLNERHYGALQGFVKSDVENGKYGHDPKQVQQWRRSWYAIPPLLEDNDNRRIEEIRKYANYCGGPRNVPRGESLDMVAKERIRPFLDDVLTPIMNDAAKLKGRTNRNNEGGTGLVVAHANSLRALIGVICQVQKDPAALKKVEAMKIQTGVPLVLKYRQTSDGNYQVCDLPEANSVPFGMSATQPSQPELPVWPLSCIPFAQRSSSGKAITQSASPQLSCTQQIGEKQSTEFQINSMDEADIAVRK